MRIALVGLLALAGCAQKEPSAGASAAAASPPVATVQPAASPQSMARFRAAGRFASLPDRGEFNRQDPARQPHHEGAYAWYPVELSEEHALAAIGGDLLLRAPSGEPIRLRYTRHVEHADGNWSWIGKSANGQDAVITFGPKAVFGSIPLRDEDPLRLVTSGGRPWMLATDRRAIAQIDTPATRPTNDDFIVPPSIEVVDPRRVAAAAASAEAAGATGAPVIDVVVGYTPGFASMLSGDSQAVTRLNNLVDITNEAYVSSQINAQVRMVYALRVEYADNTDNAAALQELTGYKSGGSVTIPESLKPLRAAREQYGADLVSLVRRFNNATNNGCGIAWLIGGGRRTITTGDEAFGYSVVSDSVGNLFPDGGYVCRDETFAHEVGHNLGSAHDKATATENGVVKYGAFTFSFGYKSGPTDGNFYTIMAYGDKGQTKNRVFSNPRINLCGSGGNLQCGVADEADNARSINATASTIGAFRATAVPVDPVPVRSGIVGDGNADGRSDIFWHNPTVQQFQGWYMNGASWSYGPVSGVGAQYRVIALGDFNADGRADIVWADQAKTQLWVWIASADGSYAATNLGAYPSGWELIGTGDANADGRADLVWHNPAAQSLQVWLMNGSSVTYGPPNAIGSQYRLASIGDFNGDGLVDFLWRDTGDATLWQWQARAGGGYTIVYMRDYPKGWTIAATGDLNGDGKADVFWHNPALQSTQAWYMQGTTWTYGGVNGIPSQYRVSTSGDFNGDGRMDILWRDSGTVWTWLANPDGSFGVNFLRDYPAGWFIWNYGAVNYGGGVYGGL